MNVFTPFYIISGAVDDPAGVSNDERTAILESTLRRKGYATAPVRGCYKGVTEPAVLVIDDREETHADLTALARVYDQESILYVDANRRASLAYTDGRTETLGQWRGTTEQHAKEQDAWTERNGQYYIVE